MMITHEFLKDVICLEYPGLRHGVDFWVGQEMDGDTQISPARIYEWTAADIPEPTDDELVAIWNRHRKHVVLEHTARDVRARRDHLLTQADIAINKALDAGDEGHAAALRAYRQTLRDIPQQAGFPLNVEWPEIPV